MGKVKVLSSGLAGARDHSLLIQLSLHGHV